MEGVLNRRRDDVAADADAAVEATTSFNGDSSPSTTASGPRHRKSSRGDSEEKKRLLGAEKTESKEEKMMELSQKMVGTKGLARR